MVQRIDQLSKWKGKQRRRRQQKLGVAVRQTIEKQPKTRQIRKKNSHEDRHNTQFIIIHERQRKIYGPEPQLGSLYFKMLWYVALVVGYLSLSWRPRAPLTNPSQRHILTHILADAWEKFPCLLRLMCPSAHTTIITTYKNNGNIQLIRELTPIT